MMIANGYAAMQRETLSGRALERAVFSRITARLEGADQDRPGGQAALASALIENNQLWMTLATDLASPGNACPGGLKAGLLSLAAFVESHTRRVIDGTASPTILIEINKNVLAGLGASESRAA